MKAGKTLLEHGKCQLTGGKVNRATNLVPRRSRRGQSWTLPWAVMSLRNTRQERVLSPALSQTSRGQRVKRERLGTRLREYDISMFCSIRCSLTEQKNRIWHIGVSRKLCFSIPTGVSRQWLLFRAQFPRDPNLGRPKLLLPKTRK